MNYSSRISFALLSVAVIGIMISNTSQYYLFVEDRNRRNFKYKDLKPKDIKYDKTSQEKFKPKDIKYDKPSQAKFKPKDIKYDKPSQAKFKPKDIKSKDIKYNNNH